MSEARDLPGNEESDAAAPKVNAQAGVARALVPAASALMPTLARVTMHPRHDGRAWTPRGPAHEIVASRNDSWV